MDKTDEKKINAEDTALIDEATKMVDSILEKRLSDIVGKEVAQTTRKTVEAMRIEKAHFGYDRTLLTDEQKSNFAKFAKNIATNFATKANEEVIPQIDSRGGYLMPNEVAAAIERVAYSVGVALSQVTRWPMGSDKLNVPAYNGSILEGAYLGVNAAGSITAVGFDSAMLQTQLWQLAFAVDNRILQSASADVGAWLVALAGEALANMVDKQVFTGTGAPFVGITQHPEVTALTLASGQDTFVEYKVIEDSSDAIASVEEAFLDSSAFYFHRSVWAKLRVQKDDTGNFLLGLGAGFNNEAFLMNDPRSPAGPRPVGNILGYPVYTVRHLPATSTVSQASVNFGVFGSLKCVGYGSKGEMTMEQFSSGTFGGKEISLANQKGLVMKQEHAVAITLPAGLITLQTHS